MPRLKHIESTGKFSNETISQLYFSLLRVKISGKCPWCQVLTIAIKETLVES